MPAVNGKSMEVAVTEEESSAPAGPALLLGPMLRYVSETEATIWVETDRQCRVEVLGRGAPTFAVAGHHYGLVVLEGLTPGSEYEYQVALDGTDCWPLPGGDFPPSVLRTLSADRPARLAFGSCRVAEIADKNLGKRERAGRQRHGGLRFRDDLLYPAADPGGLRHQAAGRSADRRPRPDCGAAGTAGQDVMQPGQRHGPCGRTPRAHAR